MARRSVASNLVACLRRLSPSGSDGFEGFLARVLGEIAALDFRLAASGSQHGRDGSAASRHEAVSFEAKLYTGKLNNNDVLGKIPGLLAGPTTPDLWILGATVEVKSQLTDLLRVIEARNGLGILILDWSPATDLPKLAVLCAMAPATVIAFLAARITGLEDAAIQQDLDDVRGTPGFADVAADLHEELTGASMGMALARARNRKWLRATFSDRRRARLALGQPLCPLVQSALPLVDRAARERVAAGFDHLSRAVMVVTGGEGCGKSWLVAQTWDRLPAPPLTVFIPATAFHMFSDAGDVEALLIEQLRTQTSDRNDERSTQRWTARFARWADDPAPDAPHLVAVVDGLNENSAQNWSLLLDRLMEYLEDRGCNLIVSVRKGYFMARVRASLESPHEMIEVGEWDDHDLDILLGPIALSAADLAPVVREALRNPRLLAIAVDLFSSGEIATAQEFSRPRLLFEHIRRLSNDGGSTPSLFIRQLGDHATAILDRIANQQLGDRFIFDSLAGTSGAERGLAGALVAVTEERYLRTVRGNDTLYQLTEDGLILALGLAVVSTVQRAERNQANLDEALDAILEPVHSLDLTADVVGAAMVVAGVGETSPVQAALIRAFLRLQNLSADAFPAFRSALRAMPNAAMEAMRAILDTRAEPGYMEWLTVALHALSDDPRIWAIFSRHLHRWIRVYSLSPYRRLNNNRGDPGYEKEVADDQKAIDTALASTSEAEKALIRDMVRDDYISPEVARQAFLLLAGQPLAPFARSLVAWALASALNPSFHDPRDEFAALIRFNPVDWAETRDALLAQSDALATGTGSRNGQWARVQILRATATQADAAEENKLVEILTAARETFGNWRLLERYCASDPCDPASTIPDNIAETAAQYRVLDVTKVRGGSWIGEVDRVFDMARCGLARFDPEPAIAVHREFALDVTGRELETFRYGCFKLEENAALLAPVAGAFIERAKLLDTSLDEDDASTGKTWVAVQFALLMSLPHLEGNEQLDVLTNLPSHGSPLVRLERLFRVASPDRLEEALRWSMQQDDANRPLMMLSFAHMSGTPLTKGAIDSIEAALQHGSGAVRGMAMAVLSEQEGARAAWERFANSGWSGCDRATREHHLEEWHGSILLIAAAQAGFLGAADVITRIRANRYSTAIRRLGDDATIAVYLQLTRALAAMKAAQPSVRPPEVSLEIQSDEPDTPPFLSLSLDAAKEIKPGRLGDGRETDEEYSERHKRYYRTYEAFRKELDREGATLILDHIGLYAIRACLSLKPEAAADWAAQLLALEPSQIPRFVNFGLQLACALSPTEPATAARLFTQFQDKRAFVHVVLGRGKTTLAAYCLWHSARSPELDALRRERLLRAKDDTAIAAEVLAASWAGQDDQVRTVVDELFANPIPVAAARALMLLGFSDLDAAVTERLMIYSNAKGLLGGAFEAARYAYERNQWAHHWYEAMCAAETPEDYWRNSTLFLKVADGRFDLWRARRETMSSTAQLFEPTIYHALDARIKDWQKKREGKLFGENCPDAVFISPAERTAF